MFGGNQQQNGTGGSKSDIGPRYNELMRAYRPTNNPDCRFQFFFYNMVDPAKIGLYSAPPGCDPRLWRHASQNNPNPKELVPSRAVGFVDLQKRLVAADKALGVYSKKLEQLSQRIAEMQQIHEAKTKPDIEAVRRNHAVLSKMLLKVVNRLESRRARGMRLDTQEMEYRKRLESLKRQLAKPAQFQSRVTELQSLARLHDERQSGPVGLQGLDMTQQKLLYQVLDTQRKGLLHLTETLRRDLRHMEIIRKQTRQQQTTARGGGLPGLPLL